MFRFRTLRRLISKIKKKMIVSKTKEAQMKIYEALKSRNGIVFFINKFYILGAKVHAPTLITLFLGIYQIEETGDGPNLRKKYQKTMKTKIKH